MCHVGGVHGRSGRSADEAANHLVLTVRGLPSTENPGGTWYVDVGLGDALHEPLPLVAGVYRQGPWTLELEATDDDLGDWHLVHDPDGGFTGMAWKSTAAPADAFDAKHEWLSTSPDSGFVQVLTAQIRDATGVTVLRGLTLKRLGEGAGEEFLTSEARYAAALGDVFGLDLGAIELGADGRRQLWDRLVAAHEEWTTGASASVP